MKKSLLSLLTLLFTGCMLWAQSAQQAPAFSKGSVKTVNKASSGNLSASKPAPAATNNNNVLTKSQAVNTPGKPATGSTGSSTRAVSVSSAPYKAETPAAAPK